MTSITCSTALVSMKRHSRASSSSSPGGTAAGGDSGWGGCCLFGEAGDLQQGREKAETAPCELVGQVEGLDEGPTCA